MIKISVGRGDAPEKTTSVLKISRDLLMHILGEKPKAKGNSLPPKRTLQKLPELPFTKSNSIEIKHKCLKLVLLHTNVVGE